MIEIERSGNVLHVRAPYHEPFLDDLRTAVPRYARTWQPEARRWKIADTYEMEVRRLLIEHFGFKECRLECEEAYRALHLLPSAPPEVAKAAYRALARIYHPDRGGDALAMQRVNIAWESLSRTLAA